MSPELNAPSPVAPSRRSLVRALLRILRFSKSTIILIALIAVLTLNVATLTIGPVFRLLSSAIETVFGLVTRKPVTIRSKHTGEIASMRRGFEKKIRTLRNDLKAESKVVKKFKHQTRAADNYIASLNKKINGLEYVNFNGRKRPISEAVQETTERISRRVATATARSTGSIAAESIPYIGIGAIVAVTTWEVHDACDTMKDLHALDLAFNPDAANDADHIEVCGQEVPTKDEIIETLKRSPSTAWTEAKSWMSDLPTWADTVQSARDAWKRIMKSTLDL